MKEETKGKDKASPSYTRDPSAATGGPWHPGKDALQHVSIYRLSPGSLKASAGVAASPKVWPQSPHVTDRSAGRGGGRGSLGDLLKSQDL